MNVMKYHQGRQAITLIEVIFSIGVIVIGLLGLISIMPVAGRNAQDAESLSVGAALGDSVMKEIQSRRWLANGSLVDSTGVPLVYTTGAAPTLVPAGPFAIDPLYVAEQAGISPFYGYTDEFFPYYSATHDPLLNPSGTPSWPEVQPRMRRIGLLGATIERARSLIERSNDLIVTRPDDRSESARFFGLETESGLEYGRRAPSGEFSWVATVSPLPGNRHASVSVVVLRNRDRTRDYPTTMPDPGPDSETDPRRNGVNERLAYVSAAFGFSGGAGGTVHLIGSEFTMPSLTVGKWVMLSRQVSATEAVHRWYRVAAVDGKIDGEVEEITINPDMMTNRDATLGCHLPSGPGPVVWRRKVLLDGPDWTFNFIDDNDTSGNPIDDFPTSFADNSYADNTFATIFTDVVSVTERVIPLTDL